MLAQEAQPVDFIEVVGLGAMVAVALLVDAKGVLCPVAGCGQIVVVILRAQQLAEKPATDRRGDVVLGGDSLGHRRGGHEGAADVNGCHSISFIVVSG